MTEIPKSKTGILYVCGTPIGNLEDITFRALKTLKEVDIIACEDTRQTSKLLNHFQFSKKLVSYHEHNEKSRAEELLLLLLKETNIALVSDAGMPGISDPGNILVSLAIKNNITVIPVAGPSAFLLTLAVSGFDLSQFIYLGFLSREKKKKEKIIESLKNETRTVVFYESPHRIIDTLGALNTFLNERNICIGREITKRFEQFWRGCPEEAIKFFKINPPRGEFCIVVQGSSELQEIDPLKFEVRLNELSLQNLSKKEISKILAKEFSLSSKNIYNQLIQKN
jgi:16S rRNA (cytidine1402-2'-O)-methyltransferase